MIAILANSAGWNEIGPSLTFRNAPLTCSPSPGTRGISSSAMPGRGDRVAVALEHRVVAQEHDRGHEHHQADHEPLRLLARQLGVDPVDHHQAERGQHRGQREQVRVGVGQPRADEQVREQAQPEEHQPVGQRARLDLVQRGARRAALAARQQHGGEPGADEQRNRDQAEQLARARAHWSAAARVAGVPRLELAHQVLGVGAAAPLVVEQALAARRAPASARARCEAYCSLYRSRPSGSS